MSFAGVEGGSEDGKEGGMEVLLLPSLTAGKTKIAVTTQPFLLIELCDDIPRIVCRVSISKTFLTRYLDSGL